MLFHILFRLNLVQAAEGLELTQRLGWGGAAKKPHGANLSWANARTGAGRVGRQDAAPARLPHGRAAQQGSLGREPRCN